MAAHSERWGSRVGLVLAVAGNAVGLGNFLRFPAQAVQNGGGAFIIPYLVSFLVMGIPLVWIEWAIGRHGGIHGHHSTPGMFDVMGRSRLLKYFGVFGIFTNLAVAAYYCYIESWTLAYAVFSVIGSFSGLGPAEISDFFTRYLDSNTTGVFNISPLALGFFLVTLTLNIWILSRGLVKGIEIVSKIGMPLLLLFGVFLAIRALTLTQGDHGALYDASVGLNFLWNPQFDSLTNPKVWLAAAGQIFFTLSVGMGSIHCYAAYVRAKEDIALNGASAAWTNEFVEVLLGGSIIIPIAVSYLGLDWVRSNIGFEMGFRTMPTLFQHWGPFFAALSGLAWFGLLFFAGITSSLAMGQPVVAFLEEQFHFSRTKASGALGIILLILGLPCALFYSKGVFGEFDYWAGTFSLYVFALGEAIVFGWIFGIRRGWEELTRGADMRVPTIFRFLMKYITPVFLLAVFVGALVKPLGDDWGRALRDLFTGQGWSLAPDSIIGTVFNIGITDTRWIVDGVPTSVFFIDMTRLMLALTFTAIAVAIALTWKKRPGSIQAEGETS